AHRPPAERLAPITLATLQLPRSRRHRTSGPPVKGLGGCPMANSSMRPSTMIAAGTLSLRAMGGEGRKETVIVPPAKDQWASRPSVVTANNSIRPSAGETAVKPMWTPAALGSALLLQEANGFWESRQDQRRGLPFVSTTNTSVTLVLDDTAAGTHHGKLLLLGRRRGAWKV